LSRCDGRGDAVFEEEQDVKAGTVTKRKEGNWVQMGICKERRIS